MKPEIETHFARVSEHVTYKLVPNPDAAAHDFTDGATLIWEEGPDWKPRGHFFVPARDLRAFAEMFTRAADIAEGEV